ncbi:MAG: ECF transporter S component [Verrucomicrobiae bacterium]|nr:ECF transporter S component [Verrucomicrobiae bacterium]
MTGPFAPAWLLPAMALALIAAGLFWFERGRRPLQHVPLIAVLAATAALGRVLTAVVPSVQPTTFLVMLAGLALGPSAGFMTGVIATIGSNFFLGQGLWTLWQAAGWGICGLSLGWIGRLWPNPPTGLLVTLGIAWGFLFGWLQNLWHWIAFVHPLNAATWIAVNAASLPFDAAHAATNALLIATAAQPLLRILHRHRQPPHG